MVQSCTLVGWQINGYININLFCLIYFKTVLSSISRPYRSELPFLGIFVVCNSKLCKFRRRKKIKNSYEKNYVKNAINVKQPENI